MSQNVTLSAIISAAQSLAVEALASGSTVTEAAEKAGVARETVSRWVHRDPEFIAELQNRRAEMAAQVRCALEALGRVVGDLGLRGRIHDAQGALAGVRKPLGMVLRG